MQGSIKIIKYNFNYQFTEKLFSLLDDLLQQRKYDYGFTVFILKDSFYEGSDGLFDYAAERASYLIG